MRTERDNGLPMIDLFAGAGGLSLGLASSGFAPLLAVERDPEASATYSALHPATDVATNAVETMTFKHLRGAIALVAAGPPCQPFSTGGKQLAADDPRDGFPHLLRVLAEIRPDGFIIENVAGLAAPSARAYFDELVQTLTCLGPYRVVWRVLNAADYGVPQKRRRLFIVGLRHCTFSFPPPTHGPGRQEPWRPSGSVVSTSEIVGEPNPSIVTYARRPDVRPSPFDGHLFNGGGRPIDMTAPAPTILASAGGNKTPFIDTLRLVPPYHAHLLAGGFPRAGRVAGARRLTVAECAMLQTFPASTEFCGARSTQYTHVGNAVPPRLAAVIGEALALTWSETEKAAAA